MKNEAPHPTAAAPHPHPQPLSHPVMHQVKVKLQSALKRQKQTAWNVQKVYFYSDIRPDSVLANMSCIPLYSAVCVQGEQVQQAFWVMDVHQ